MLPGLWMECGNGLITLKGGDGAAAPLTQQFLVEESDTEFEMTQQGEETHVFIIKERSRIKSIYRGLVRYLELRGYSINDHYPEFEIFFFHESPLTSDLVN